MNKQTDLQVKARCLKILSLAIDEFTGEKIPGYNADFYGLLYDYLGYDKRDLYEKHIDELLSNPLINVFGIKEIMSPTLTQSINTSIEDEEIYLSIDISNQVTEKLIRFFSENPNELYNTSPRQFEKIIKELFDGFGYATELTKRTRDGGFDIVAVRSYEVNTRYLIECKRNSPENKVGIGVVRQLHSTKTDKMATKGILATTSFFTSPANSFLEKHKWELEGKDYDGIMRWLKIYLSMKR